MSQAPSGPAFVAGSWRDRSARVFLHCGKFYRALTAAAARDWSQISATEFFRQATATGEIVQTHPAPELHPLVHSAGYTAVLAHQRVDAISWPWEWSFSMLQTAALLQLNLMARALRENCILSDATPFNFQFAGVRPLLIDTGSLVVLRPVQTWEGYRQFCQQFLYPLLLQAWKGVDFQPWLRGRMEGIPAEQFAALLSARDLLRKGALSHVWLHARLAQHGQSMAVADSLSSAGFHKDLILTNVTGLQRLIQKLRWNRQQSTWSHYVQQAAHVTVDQPVKSEFVRAVCQQQTPRTVWDLGCNLGHYSRIAAETSQVLAMDADHLTIDHLYRQLQAEPSGSVAASRITPLVMNIADPSPSLGWRHEERVCLEQRSQPDLVFCLALIHHLVIGNNLRLNDVLDWLRSLNAVIILEWVDRRDPMVIQLLRNRRDVFYDYEEDRFLSALQGRFRILRTSQLPSATRRLYLLAPASSSAMETTGATALRS